MVNWLQGTEQWMDIWTWKCGANSMNGYEVMGRNIWIFQCILNKCFLKTKTIEQS